MWIYCHGISSITLVHGRGKWYANFKTDKFRPGVVFTIFQISSIKRGHVIFTKPSYWITESLGRFFFPGRSANSVVNREFNNRHHNFLHFLLWGSHAWTESHFKQFIKICRRLRNYNSHVSANTLRFLLCSIILSRFHLLKNGREDLKLAGIKDGFQEVENQ